MKKTVTIETETEEINEVKALWNVEEVNVYLAKGWILLHGSIAHRDAGGFQAKPCWLIAKKRER